MNSGASRAHFGESPLFPDSRFKGGQSLIVRETDGDSSYSLEYGASDPEGVHGLEHFQEVYFAYTFRDAGAFPGPDGKVYSFSTVSSTKDAWMMFGRRGDNTEYSVDSLDEPSGHDLYIPGWTGGGFNLAGNNTATSPSYWHGNLKDNWDFGGWVTKMFHAKLDGQDPYGDAQGFFAFINAKAGYRENTRSGNFMSDQTDEGVPYPYWDRIKFYAWLRQGDADVRRVLDEVYVAVGDHASARVVITDSGDLESSSLMVHRVPGHWSDSLIDVEAASLSGVENFYVHVISADGDHAVSDPVCVACKPRAPSVSVH